MPLPMQVKLLRVLQERVYERVGAVSLFVLMCVLSLLLTERWSK